MNMDYETVGKLIFAHNRLKFEIDACRASGTGTGSADWAALLADVAAMDLAFDSLQRREARFDTSQAEAMLALHQRARDAFKALQC